MEDIIRNTLRMYSYSASEECIKSIADNIREALDPKDEKVVYDKIDETEDSVLFHVHFPGKEGHRYWIPKEPLNVTFTSEGVQPK